MLKCRARGWFKEGVREGIRVGVENGGVMEGVLW